MSIEKIIAVMGPNEEDKATFIDEATGSKVRTKVPFTSSFLASEPSLPLAIEGLTFSYRFLHFPAIGSATATEAETLILTTHLLAALYKDDVTLNGVLYIMDDAEVEEDAYSNFEIVERLCGSEIMPNFVILTPIPLQSSDPWGRAIAAGARCICVSPERAVLSVERVLRHWYKRSRKVLDVQREMVDQGLETPQTSTGQVLQKELMKQLRERVEALCSARSRGLTDTAIEARQRITELIRQLHMLDATSQLNPLLSKLPSKDVDLADISSVGLIVPQQTREAPSMTASTPSTKKRSLEEQVEALAQELAGTQNRLSQAERKIEELETQMKDTTTLVLPPLPERGPDNLTLRIKLT